MRIPITEEQRTLSNVMDPYMIREIGTDPKLKDNVPENVKKAYERFMEIAKEQDDLMISLM